MLELSIPARLAFIFVLLMLANREFKKFDNITSSSWKDIIFSAVALALYTFIAGGMLVEAIQDILYMPMG